MILYLGTYNYFLFILYWFLGYDFCLGSVSKNFTEDKQGEISWNDIAYDFAVDHSSVKKEDILNIHQYLMVENNIK